MPVIKTTTFSYDLLDRLTTSTNPLNQATTLSYDTRDNLKATTDPKGQIITRTYDDLSRLIQINTPDNTITVSYDAVGNPQTVVDNDSRIGLTYDGLNRIATTETFDLGAQPNVILTNVYDAVGNRRGLTDSAPGTTVFDFDLGGRLTQLTTPSSQQIHLTYDPAGRLEAILFPNGVVSTHQYDPQGRLASLSHALGTNPSFAGFGYAYNPVGNILSITEPSRTRTFTYDALQRLTKGGTDLAMEPYTYDSRGEPGGVIPLSRLCA